MRGRGKTSLDDAQGMARGGRYKSTADRECLHNHSLKPPKEVQKTTTKDHKMSSIKKQIALIGDRRCGKTSLAVRLSCGLFMDYYRPTQLVDDFTAELETGKVNCRLTLLDLAGSSKEDDGIRSLAYGHCDAVVVCFDLTDPASLESVTNKWLPELEAKCPGVPLILAGCKLDKTCVDLMGEVPCPQVDLIRDFAKDILVSTRAKAYIECSSKSTDGLDELAELVLEVAQKKRTAAKKLAASIKSSRLLKKLSIL